MHRLSSRKDETSATRRVFDSRLRRARATAILGVATLALLALAPLRQAEAAVLTVNNGGLCSDVTGVPAYCTIQAAVNAAAANDTINVAAGTYAELVRITKTLTLNGAQQGVDARTRSGAETIVGSSDGGFQILADDVIIDGFTIEGATADCGTVLTATCAGIHADNSTAGRQILNNIIQNNIIGIFLNTAPIGNPSLVQFNLIQNNNASPLVSGSGNGIDSETGLSNTTIDSNTFSGNVNSTMLIIGLGGPATMLTISNNQADNSMDFGRVTASSITGNVFINSVASSVFIGGEDDGIAISCNTFFNGMTRGVRINNDGTFFTGINKNITVNNNDFFGNAIAGITVDPLAHMGTVDATNNWWGCAAGPGNAGCDIVDGDANFTPFLASSSPCAPFDDGDGVSGFVEALAPNGGDGNNDGTPDKYQPDVASLPSATGRGYLTVVVAGSVGAPAGCSELMDVHAVTEGAGGNDPRFDYPLGLVGFQLNGCPAPNTANITVILHGGVGLPFVAYRNFGPEAPNFAGPSLFYTLPGVVFGTTTIPGEGSNVPTASFTLTDNLLGDSSGALGTIVELGGPAVAVRDAPVASTTGLVGLTVLLGAVGWLALRRPRFRVTQTH